MSCLHVQNLTVQFPTAAGTILAVDGVSFDHEREETLAIVGETGCGKSVIALAVMGLLPGNTRVRGRIHFMSRSLLEMEEKDLSRMRGKDMAIVLQNPTLALNPLQTIGRQVAEMYRWHERLDRKASLSKARRLLERMGLKDVQNNLQKYPFQFSEGMNQRVQIATAFALSPRLIIADEPTKGLDDRLKDEVTDELVTIIKEKKTSLLLITHDLGVAGKISDRLAVMYAGEMVEEAPVDEFFRDPLHPYSRAFLQSLPENGFIPIPGQPPSMITPPVGCKFSSRCPEKMDICTRQKPGRIPLQRRNVQCHLYR